MQRLIISNGIFGVPMKFAEGNGLQVYWPHFPCRIFWFGLGCGGVTPGPSLVGQAHTTREFPHGRASSPPRQLRECRYPKRGECWHQQEQHPLLFQTRNATVVRKVSRYLGTRSGLSHDTHAQTQIRIYRLKVLSRFVCALLNVNHASMWYHLCTEYIRLGKVAFQMILCIGLSSRLVYEV